jgi:hypothetical protein
MQGQNHIKITNTGYTYLNVFIYSAACVGLVAIIRNKTNILKDVHKLIYFTQLYII